jgi:hypothetical protein
MDLSTRPYWRVDTYLEYPGTEMWEMHHDPLRRVDLFEREKRALSFGVHAVFGIRHVGAHMPLLWPWRPPLTPGEKSARYLLSNREMDHYRGSALKRLEAYDSVRVYEVMDWKPRFEILRRDSAITASETCPAGFSGYGGLCVFEPRDGQVRIRGDFRPGDTLVFREHRHGGWRLRIGPGPWQNPGAFGQAFMAVEFRENAKEAEWRF